MSKIMLEGESRTLISNPRATLILDKSSIMQLMRKHLGKLSLLISLFTLLQGCVVYHKTPVSLEQAAKAGTKAKIVMSDGSLAKYKYITEIKGKYYGVNKKSGMWVETPTNINPDTEVFLKNKPTSRLLTWGLIAYSASSVAVLTWFAIAWDIYP